MFRDAWKGTPVAAPAAAADGTGWPLEQCSYWLNGLVDLGFVLHDDALIRKATRRLALVVDGVNRGGTSLIYWKKDKPQGFNSWAQSQMGRALVEWYKATGEQRILDALVQGLRRLSRAHGPASHGRRREADCATSTPCSRPTPSAAIVASRSGSARPSVKRRSPRPSGTGSTGGVVPDHAVGVTKRCGCRP